MDTIRRTTMLIDSTPQALLRLLQLVSPALPVGAYSYSEGLETVVQTGTVGDASTLERWLIQELRWGAIRLEAAVVTRVYDCVDSGDVEALTRWNQWLSAMRETEEMRSQSWQMGRSLTRLLQSLEPELRPAIAACGEPCNFAIAFSLAAAHWQINREVTVLAYLHSWVSNLVNAGVRLIPLGQTQGQQVLLNVYPQTIETVQAVLVIPDDELYCCSWGVAIASMNHETLYSRLFRS
ncbi:urease accessory protein UreF [Oculatella sp. LEGE 06141]|uniref:urease accessory protein UreF n=1 Tax=Oculatella sp. LEGE 06141 TaxID=1828648 RepID=UPI00188305D6|nr:urease accessory protein UreF [Oculatella sp. LEGE 06141]MBE9181960.1 urease accessory protein UreF [Oculatella sp. LEGE 06141]